MSNINVTAENVNITAENVNITAENVNITAENVNIHAKNMNISAENVNITAENVNIFLVIPKKCSNTNLVSSYIKSILFMITKHMHSDFATMSLNDISLVERLWSLLFFGMV